MGQITIKFGNIETEKRKVHHCKNLLQDIYTDSILMSSMISSGKKNIYIPNDSSLFRRF